MQRASRAVPGARIRLSLGHYQPSRRAHQRRPRRRWSTPTTRGSATGSASPSRRIAGAEETVADMAAAAGRARRWPTPGSPPPTSTSSSSPPARSVDRCPNVATRVAAQARHQRARPRSTSTPPAPASRYAPGHGRPRDPGRRGAQRARDRRREALRLHRLDRPVDRDHLRRRRRRRGRRPRRRRRARPASARSSGAPRRRRATLITIEGWRPYIEQEGQAVFRWATTALAPVALAGLRAGRRRPGRASPRSSPHQANLRIIDGIAKRLGRCPTRVVAKDIVESGNTSAASDPAGAVEAGRAARGAAPAPRCCCSASAAASPTPGRSSAARDACP